MNLFLELNRGTEEVSRRERRGHSVLIKHGEQLVEFVLLRNLSIILLILIWLQNLVLLIQSGFLSVTYAASV